MSSFRTFFRTGRPWIWLSAAGISLILFMILGMLLVLISNSFSFIWPPVLEEFKVAEQRIIGQRITQPAQDSDEAILVRVANRDVAQHEYLWLDARADMQVVRDPNLVLVERRWNGDFIGYLKRMVINGDSGYEGKDNNFVLFAEQAKQLHQQIERLKEQKLQHINQQFEQLQAQLPEHQRSGSLLSSINSYNSEQLASLREQYLVAESELNQLMQRANASYIVIEDSQRQAYQIPMLQVINLYLPNQMTVWQKLGYSSTKVAQLFSQKTSDANSAGGIYPALLGTVVMVFVMTLIVAPLGVVAAIYLHEYAREGWMKRMIHLSVVNLAGIPSIIYGVFGLGFFVYGLGGSIDQLFYSDSLPSPTFGTPGLLWCSLTLALLTLPIVIVTTEQGMARIPQELRHGSLALGATRLETVWRLVLPAAVPAMLTGLVLAIARAAGEVAAVMLVGVAKNTPALPIGNEWPYIHLEQQVMHLGFMVYDAGLHSPHLYSARPLVFASALVLVLITIVLNMMAMGIRGRLQDKYRYFVS